MFVGFFAVSSAIAAVFILHGAPRTALVLLLLMLYVPGAIIILLAVARSTTARDEVTTFLVDSFRLHPAARLRGALRPLGVLVAGVWVFSLLLYVPFVSVWGALRIALYRAAGRRLPYEKQREEGSR